MKPQHDSALDRAIDAVAGRMTAAEPAAAFRARVLARIDRPRRRLAPASGWMAAAVSAAAVVLLALAIGGNRSGPGRSQPSERTVLPSTPIAYGAAVPHHETRPVVIASTASGVVARGRVAAESAVAVLAPPPLDVASLAIAPMNPGESIQISELETIAPITLTPIGDPQGERR
jgi:hypothetical protein